MMPSSLIWNPFFGYYTPTQQEEGPSKTQDAVLDLTTVKRSQEEADSLMKKELFDFRKFYKTYQEIASREPTAKKNRKRQLSSGSSDSDQSLIQETKKQRIDNIPVIPKGDFFNSKHVLKERQNPPPNAAQGQKRDCRSKEQKIASIRDSCDCRFCYEDHIIKLRLKRNRTWTHV